MSSEMRELVQKWRVENHRGDYKRAVDACADELEALLARFESGPHQVVEILHAMRSASQQCAGFADRIAHALAEQESA